MQSHRIISGITIFLMVVIVAIGYFFVAQPQLAAASAATDQLAGVSAQNAASQALIGQLKGDQAKLPALRSQLATLRGSIPTDAQISSYIDGLNALASSAGVSITGITVAPGVIYTPPIPPATATPTPSASASPSASPSPTASTSPVAAAAPPVATAWTPTTDSSITGANFVAIPVTINTSGQTANILAFIKGLQSGSRLFLVSGITSAADDLNPGAISGNVTGYIYVLLDPTETSATSADVQSGSITTTPTATPTATTTPSPSGSATPTPTQSPTPTKKP